MKWILEKRKGQLHDVLKVEKPAGAEKLVEGRKVTPLFRNVIGKMA